MKIIATILSLMSISFSVWADSDLKITPETKCSVELINPSTNRLVDRFDIQVKTEGLNSPEGFGKVTQILEKDGYQIEIEIRKNSGFRLRGIARKKLKNGSFFTLGKHDQEVNFGTLLGRLKDNGYDNYPLLINTWNNEVYNIGDNGIDFENKSVLFESFQIFCNIETRLTK
jgi:hypothetical protein